MLATEKDFQAIFDLFEKGDFKSRKAAAVMLGFKKYVTDSKQLYIGHKSSFTRVKGPEVSGVNFDDVDFYTATFQLGYEF